MQHPQAVPEIGKRKLELKTVCVRACVRRCTKNENRGFSVLTFNLLPGMWDSFLASQVISCWFSLLALPVLCLLFRNCVKWTHNKEDVCLYIFLYVCLVSALSLSKSRIVLTWNFTNSGPPWRFSDQFDFYFYSASIIPILGLHKT